VRAAFLQGRLRSFLPYGPEDLPGRIAIERAAPREALAAALEAYLTRLGAPEPSLASARRLAHPKSRAVVTGQQAGLLTGPAFTLYKAHSALKLAYAYDDAERPVVGLFWVASQDHDTAEVSRVHFLDMDEQIRELALDLPEGVPVARVPFGPYRAEVRAFLEGFGGHTAVRRRIEEALDGDWTYAEAFARLLLAFLGPHGVVPLDPMAPELAPLFAPAMERELEDPLASSMAINAAGEALKSLGLPPSLGRPAGATNVFLEGEDGRRRLLHYDDGTFSDGVRSYRREDLRAILHADPSRLTPAAGLRPVVQDAVVPTAGLVVGPGEMAYVAQLAGVYRLHGLEPPAIIDRMHGLVLEPPVRRILEKYGLDPWAFLEAPEEAMLEALARTSTSAAELERGLRRVEDEFSRMLAALPALDPTLVGAFESSQRRLEGEIERLRGKLLAAELATKRTVRDQHLRLLVHLRPLGRPQERVYGFLGHVLKHGPEVLERLCKAPARGRVNLEA
jgi:bacillithiol biosynthesis cysteine-adding enzyme BshC